MKSILLPLFALLSTPAFSAEVINCTSSQISVKITCSEDACVCNDNVCNSIHLKVGGVIQQDVEWMVTVGSYVDTLNRMIALTLKSYPPELNKLTLTVIGNKGLLDHKEALSRLECNWATSDNTPNNAPNSDARYRSRRLA